jgi:catechol 2,3-dioxygenase-like lactoylglutathione lyase family enzyme
MTADDSGGGTTGQGGRTGQGGVRELRIVLTVEDFDGAVRLFRDALGLAVDDTWDGENGRGAILSAPRATLELLDAAQSGFVDQVEAGRRGVSGPVRLGVEVPDSADAARRLVAAGAVAVGDPVTTPWGQRTARVAVPGGMQLTLFSVPSDVPGDVPGDLPGEAP